MTLIRNFHVVFLIFLVIYFFLLLFLLFSSILDLVSSIRSFYYSIHIHWHGCIFFSCSGVRLAPHASVHTIWWHTGNKNYQNKKKWCEKKKAKQISAKMNLSIAEPLHWQISNLSFLSNVWQWWVSVYLRKLIFVTQCEIVKTVFCLFNVQFVRCTRWSLYQVRNIVYWIGNINKHQTKYERGVFE